MLLVSGGRVNSALDPAPIQMFWRIPLIIVLEYILNENGHRMQFKVDNEGRFILKGGGRYNPEKQVFRVISIDSLIPDSKW